MQSPIQAATLVTSVPSPILASYTLNYAMDGDDVDMSVTDDTPSESVELSAYERQRASLQTYIDSLPYGCESTEEMQEKLEKIVGKIFVCAKAKNWLVLSTWDGMLQWYLYLFPSLSDHVSELLAAGS
jgi:hypothetical protein